MSCSSTRRHAERKHHDHRLPRPLHHHPEIAARLARAANGRRQGSVQAPLLAGRACLGRPDPRRHRERPVETAERTRQRPDAVLAYRRPDEPPPGQRAHEPRMGRDSNHLVYRVTEMYPDNFAPVGMLPQSPYAPPANSIPELRRIVEELGFVGVNLNPDPTGGYWTGTPVTDRSWYPLYEVLSSRDVPAMIHVAASCNPCFHGTGAHYLNADTSVFM
ncbi:amidohydrolase family protein [Massilia phosphatilytica]